MSRRLVYLIPLALFFVVAGYFLLGLQRDPRQLPSAMIGKPVPTFSLPPLNGRATTSQNLGLTSDDLKRGEVVLVNVFASWCGPCRVEHPILADLAASRRLKVFAINYKDRPEDAVGWLRRLGDPYAALGADRDGRVAIEWGVYGVPETFVVDGDGIIRYRRAGPLDKAEIEQNLLPLLSKLRG